MFLRAKRDLAVQAHHSKDNTIASVDSDQGFDTQTNAAFPSTTFDAMHQAVCGCHDNEVAYNVWDWEFLRSKFSQLSSHRRGNFGHRVHVWIACAKGISADGFGHSVVPVHADQEWQLR
jgi:hypothetical protein